MTSPLLLQSIQQDCEAHHTGSEEGTAGCLTSSFGIWSGLGHYVRGGREFFRERPPDRDSVHLSIPSRRHDFYM